MRIEEEEEEEEEEQELDEHQDHTSREMRGNSTRSTRRTRDGLHDASQANVIMASLAAVAVAVWRWMDECGSSSPTHASLFRSSF